MAAPPPLIPMGQQTFRWIVPQFCQQGRLTTLVTGAEAASWLRDLRVITIEPLKRCCCYVDSTEPWIHQPGPDTSGAHHPPQTLCSEPSADVARALESP